MELASKRQNEKQTVYIKTFGCQMNEADSERMYALLGEAGLEPTHTAEQANVIIINGCTVRAKAIHKAVSALGELQFLKKYNHNNKTPIIGMGGCVGQFEKQMLFKQAPWLDFVFGPDAIDQLPEMIFRVQNGEKHVINTDFDVLENYSTETKLSAPTSKAFVNIMKGCDKYCTYCIVPYTRGKEKSRTIDEILSDVARLVSLGIKEVTFLGQNVNSFGKGNKNLKNREPKKLHNIIGRVGPDEDEENFPQLLKAIDQDERLKNLRRVRFTSSHPLDFSDELINCYASPEQGGVSKLAQHLHLPVQSGSNRILEKMGRHHKIEAYISQMDRLRALMPKVGLSTDIIVGFPTETQTDFEQTLQLLDRIQYDNIFAFAYSPRIGTRAAKLNDDISLQEKNRRLQLVLKHQLKISEKRNTMFIDKTMEILVDNIAKNQILKKDDKNSTVWMGRTSCNHVVNFLSHTSSGLEGQFLKVKITGSTPLSLIGGRV
ncbi:MAG: tRNA (N6-isopentenyl adenosine(37)-C2)-methylthiotransferase MiaB [Deltaproteobacteria bacterium]|nr:tRNA (N6-isopentenyl adenosine(37)-C2)-methylthiotransferase MiaB [Deltaproteobacteria bacterium]